MRVLEVQTHALCGLPKHGGLQVSLVGSVVHAGAPRLIGTRDVFFPLKCVFRSTTRSPGPPDESADKLHAHASNGHRVLRVQQHCDAHRHYCAFCSPGLGSTPGPCLRRPRRRWFFYRAPCLGSRARRANRSARPVRASTAQIARST